MHLFLILVQGGPPPSQLVPKSFNWSPNTVFDRYLICSVFIAELSPIYCCLVLVIFEIISFRLWRDIGSQGSLWTWVHLCAHRGNIGSIPGILKSARLFHFYQILLFCVHKAHLGFRWSEKSQSGWNSQTSNFMRWEVKRSKANTFLAGGQPFRPENSLFWTCGPVRWQDCQVHLYVTKINCE